MGTKWFLFLISLSVVNGDFDHVMMSQNELFAIPTMRTVCEGYQFVNISESCMEQLDVVCNETDLLWTMFDASSKFPYPGLNYSSKLDYGNFDQCMTINHHYEGGRILGKHCTIGLLIPDPNDNIYDYNTHFKLSMCRPDKCYGADFNDIVMEVANLSEFPLFQDLMCYTVETYSEYTTLDIVTLTIFAICIFLMIVSTIYDVYLYYNNLKNPHPLFTAFSVLSNGRKLFHISKHTKSKEVIEPFHGLRVISMIWIVAGHGFVGWQLISVVNRELVDHWLEQRYAGYIAASHIAVDTFFYMSGFLIAFQYFKRKGKPILTQVASVPQMYIHRYLRLTPAMAMVYLTVISIYIHLGDGPLWTYNDSLAKSCKDNAMSFFLYIQNYYNYDDLCITQTWYLSADMQMFLLAPFVIIPLAYVLEKPSGFTISMIGLFILNVVCTLAPIAIKLTNPDYTNEYDTHSRLIAYFIGVMLGVFMREKIDKPFLYMCKEQHRRLLNLVIWAVIILEMVATLVIFQDMEMHYGWNEKAIFHSLMRPAWAIGLCWITYACHQGYGGFVNWVLCRPIFQVLGRLTYCIYLLHGNIIAYYLLSTRVRWFFTDYNAFYIFCGHYIVSIILALFWTLAFESPLIVVEKFLMGGGRKPSPKIEPEPRNGNTEEATKKEEGPRPSGEVPQDVEVGGHYNKQNEV